MQESKQVKLEMAIQMLKLMDTLRLEVMFSPVDFDFIGYYQQFH